MTYFTIYCLRQKDIWAPRFFLELGVGIANIFQMLSCENEAPENAIPIPRLVFV